MNSKELWADAWPAKLHKDEHAKKRISSATSLQVTPLSVDNKNFSATFFNKHNKKRNYITTLTSCTCVDFILNERPCKHIYRLAIELGIIHENKESYCDRAFFWEEVADIIESFDEKTQRTFASAIKQNRNYETISVRKKKSKELSLLIEKGIFVLDEETPKFVIIHLKADFTPEIYRVYQYFNRKFNPPKDLIYGDYVPLADDSRTERLLKKGFAYRTDEGVFIKGTV